MQAGACKLTKEKSVLTESQLARYAIRNERISALPDLKAQVMENLPAHEDVRSREILWVLIGMEIMQMLNESIEPGTQSGFYSFRKALDLMEKTGFSTNEKLISLLTPVSS